MMLVVSLASFLLTVLPLPEGGRTPVNAVEYQVVHDLVLRKAEAEWPGCRLGPVIPYLDENGATAGYMFHFRTDGQTFPDQEQVTLDVLADRERLTVNTDLTKWRSKYACILASASYDRPPFVYYGYGTSEYYAIGEKALARARQVLGSDATLTRIYFIECRTFLEFGNQAGDHVVYSNHFDETWNSRQAFVEEVSRRRQVAREHGYDPEAAAAVHEHEWQEALGRDFTDFTEYYVPNVDKAPFYDWSYGCTPTSGAMVLGYIDRTQNYGRLVDQYALRWDRIEGENDWQIPNTQRECAIAMNTDTVNNGGTYVSYIASGLRNAAQGNNNNYTCTVTEAYGSSGNDWAWSTITGQINGGYAFIWSAMWESHSLACFGYRTPEKDVYVHNTWWMPAAWWHYSGNNQSHVASPHMSGGDVHRLNIVYPVGDTFYNSNGRGEILQVGDTANVTWTSHGNPGTRVDIEISQNHGKTWQILAANLPDNGLYKWYVSPSQPASDSVRLRLRQYNGSTLTSSDASFGNFVITREPLPPKFLAPPNGQQIFAPPIVLVVDSLYSGDSLDFRLIYAGDTLVRRKTTSNTCPLPDSLFQYGKSYKWTCRAHNQFGWGQLGTPWSFWIRFSSGVSEQGLGAVRPGLRVKAVNVTGEVAFEIAAAVPGSRLVIYNALGSVVRELAVTETRVSWDRCSDAGVRQAAGLYFAQLISGPGVATVKFILAE
ncbi:MAG: hypothetical protein ABIL25_04145 [candidate division WOR-3 bacterium]